MFTLTTSLPDEKWCVEVLRKVRWNGGGQQPICPYCQSANIKREGWYRKLYQKYYCKSCDSWFNDKTGTMFHYSRTPLGSWFLTLYLFFVLWPGCSTREAALEAGVVSAAAIRQTQRYCRKRRVLHQGGSEGKAVP